jgi:hypothetical protein
MPNNIVKGALIALVISLFVAPVAFAKVLKVAPAQLELKDAQDKAADKWTFAIREVYDKRAGEVVGTRAIGMADQRFSDEDAVIELDREPAVFLREQVGRFLFLRGMEASSLARAKVLVDLSLNRFELESDSKGLADKTTFNLGFTAKFITRGGDEIGSVTLNKSQWIKKVMLFGAEKALAELINSALVGSLESLEKNEIYLKAAAR